jgi:hypothetical protein
MVVSFSAEYNSISGESSRAKRILNPLGLSQAYKSTRMYNSTVEPIAARLNPRGQSQKVSLKVVSLIEFQGSNLHFFKLEKYTPEPVGVNAIR